MNRRDLLRISPLAALVPRSLRRTVDAATIAVEPGKTYFPVFRTKGFLLARHREILVRSVREVQALLREKGIDLAPGLLLEDGIDLDLYEVQKKPSQT